MGMGVRRRRRVGRGVLGDLWKKAKNVLVPALSKLHEGVKKNKSISRALGYSKHKGKSSVLGDFAHQLGYGRRRKMVGKGFFGDAWRWIKGAAGTVNNVLKKTGVLGKLLPGPFGIAARAVGYGKKRVVRRRRVGRGIFGDAYRRLKYSAIGALDRVHKNIKDARLISRALGYHPKSSKSTSLGTFARNLGYGRKRGGAAMRMHGGAAMRMHGGATMTVMPRRVKSTQMLQAGGRLNRLGYGRPRGGSMRQMGGKLNQLSF